MKLADYLHRHRITPSTLRRDLGVRSRATVLRYLSGERIPEPRLLQKIIDLTRGHVQLTDFLSPELPECAVRVTLSCGSSRLVFPWTTRNAELDASLSADDEEDDSPSLALQKALAILGPRVHRRSAEIYLVDERMTDVRGVIQAANRMLRLWGKPTIPYPGVANLA
jgi:hypothetical protein